MKAYAIAIALLLITIGCRKEPQAPVEIEQSEPPAKVEPSTKVEAPVRVEPRTKVESPVMPKSPAYHLKFRSWSGMGSYAEFTHTSLRAVEIDLMQGRIRKLEETASRPEPMLPSDDGGVTALLEKTEWADLPAEQALAFQKAIKSWLDTEPPAEYSSPMTLGREIGHVTSLSVSWDGNTVTTTLNPRAQSGENDLPKLSAQWKTLIGLLGVDEEKARGML